jgi:calcium-dependent protein kinase
MGNEQSSKGQDPRSKESSSHDKRRKGDVPACSDERESVHQTKNTRVKEQPQAPRAENVTISQDPPASEPSVNTFAGNATNCHTLSPAKDGIMITDALTDVRAKYHINPKELGHGHYGVVRKCMNRETKEWLAIKSIRKSKVGKVEVLKREIDILKEVNHPNIIKLIEIHEDSKYLHLVTELCTGGELFDRIIAKTQSPEGHFSEQDAAFLIQCILDAIRYCHEEKQIVHRDLKPENFLFKTQDEDAPIKIIDFGLSRHDNTASHGVMKTKVGTPYYVAPEVLRREYTKSCDIWSIGVITYILLCGYPPFYGDSDNQIFDSVRTGRFDFPSPDWDNISNAAKDFICCLLRKDPSLRLTAREALSHKWIVTANKKNMRDAQSLRVSHDSVRSDNFKKYLGIKKLKRAALVHIASRLTNTEVGSLGDIFKQLDKNGDGQLTLEELSSALQSGTFVIMQLRAILMSFMPVSNCLSSALQVIVRKRWCMNCES